jgi:hypothetical protein
VAYHSWKFKHLETDKGRSPRLAVPSRISGYASREALGGQQRRGQAPSVSLSPSGTFGRSPARRDERCGARNPFRGISTPNNKCSPGLCSATGGMCVALCDCRARAGRGSGRQPHQSVSWPGARCVILSLGVIACTAVSPAPVAAPHAQAHVRGAALRRRSNLKDSPTG